MRWVVMLLVLVGCGEDPQITRVRKEWDGAELIKICHSGTYIYRLSNGEYRTGGVPSAKVTNPETVC